MKEKEKIKYSNKLLRLPVKFKRKILLNLLKDQKSFDLIPKLQLMTDVEVLKTFKEVVLRYV